MYSPPQQPRMNLGPNPNARKDSPTSPTSPNNNLPPAEVAKTIPCRNFPACRYGPACVFYHPGRLPQQQQQGFFPGMPMGMGGSFMPGYEGFNGGYQPMQYYQPQPQAPQQLQQDSQDLDQDQQQQQQQQSQASGLEGNDGTSEVESQAQTLDQTASTSDLSSAPAPAPAASASSADLSETQQNQNQISTPVPNSASEQASAPHSMSSSISALQNSDPSIIPVFVPGQAMNPAQQQFQPLSPAQFGQSPLSPSAITSVPPYPESGAAAFFATSPPPNTFIPGQNSFAARRQSFNQNQYAPGGGAKAFGTNTNGNGKKPSFSGGPRPWAPNGRMSMSGGAAGSFGVWKDGMPPPCAFFTQAKCRNGEFCKFPHLDAEGNDCEYESA